ncbi:hypothetical protein DER46DRAFT_567958 [Fusarium sp. MPI-SDFR-AT-0072]|nr:hypothetical protein DER46DRAFT_567958 [Fusarium sp. MPI-SDFR-AT-0072]
MTLLASVGYGITRTALIWMGSMRGLGTKNNDCRVVKGNPRPTALVLKIEQRPNESDISMQVVGGCIGGVFKVGTLLVRECIFLAQSKPISGPWRAELPSYLSRESQGLYRREGHMRSSRNPDVPPNTPRSRGYFAGHGKGPNLSPDSTVPSSYSQHHIISPFPSLGCFLTRRSLSNSARIGTGQDYFRQPDSAIVVPACKIPAGSARVLLFAAPNLFRDS